jgi:hypothetical protein
VLTSGITSTATDIPVESVEPSLAYPAYLVMDPDSPTKREYIKVIGVNGLSFDTGTTGNRGLDGSVGGTGLAHDAGATMRAVSVKQWLDDIFDDIEDLEDDGLTYLLLDGSRAMAGALDMGGSNQINLLANGVADQDATTVKQVTEELLLLLPLDGTRAMTGALDMGTDKIANVVDPTLAQDAATKNYVDTAGLYLKLDGTSEMTGALLHTNGTAAAPAITFGSTPDLGMYRLAAAVFGWAVSGAEAMSLGNGLRIGPSATGAAFMPVAEGTESNPAYSFNGDLDTGAYLLGTNTMAFVGGGNEQFRTGNQGAPGIIVAGGTAAIPGVRFDGATDQGMYQFSATELGLAANGTLAIRVSDTRFRVSAFLADTTVNPASATASGSDGRMQRSTSAMAVKENFEPLVDPLDVIRRLNPFSFNSKIESDGDGRFAGFGAEEVAEVIPEAGMDENYDVRAVVAYLVAAVQELTEE